MVSSRHNNTVKKYKGFVQKGKKNEGIVDWTELDNDLVIEFFSRLNNLDRGSLSSTCKTWKSLGSSPSLWQSLDVRAYEFTIATAQSLASRCRDLSRLTFNDAQSPQPIMSLGAHNLKELIGYRCENITDSTLSAIVAAHPLLQTLQLGPALSTHISSEAIRNLANCCPNLRKLKLSGIPDINEGAIKALASCCKNLTEISFTDCLNINETTLGNIMCLRFLSVAGTQNINWASVYNSWGKLPDLVGVDVSRTNVDEDFIYGLFSSSRGLRVICALDCPQVPAPTTFNKLKMGAKRLLRDADDMYKWISSTVSGTETDEKKCSKKGFLVGGDKEMDTLMMWLECVFSHFFLSHYKRNPEVTSDFWCQAAAILLFSLIESKQEDIVEIGMETISNLKTEEAITSHWFALWYEEIGLLLRYCKSHKEGLQLHAIKAIASLLTDVHFYKSIVSQGGISILADLTESMSSFVTKEAARGFWHITNWADCENVIDTGGINALIKVLSKWSHNEGILWYTTTALANLGYYKRTAMEVQRIGAVDTILKLAFGCSFQKVTQQALLAVANLSYHGNKDHDFAGIGKRPGVIGSLMEFTDQSYPDDIRFHAVNALSNLCCYEGYSKSCIAAGVVEAFVALAQPGNSPVLQEKAAEFLLLFSFVKENSIAIGERNGIEALIELSRSNIPDVRNNAVRGICSLALVPCNATRIKSAGGVPLLIEFCNLTQSRQEKLCSTLALACMCGERNVDFRINDNEILEKTMALDHIGNFILTECDPTIFSFVAASPTPSILEKQAKALFIRDEGILESSDWIIEELISLLRNSYDNVKACVAFALVQVIASDNPDWMNHTKYVQEAGGPKILRVLAASKAAPDSVRVLSKILLFCLEKNQQKLESSSNNSSEI